jgi:hypothetical protein
VWEDCEVGALWIQGNKASRMRACLHAYTHTHTHTHTASFVIRSRLTRLMMEAEKSQIRGPSRAISVQKLAGSGARKS